MTILEEAAEITAIDRQKYYGHPLDNHNITAGFFTVYLTEVFKKRKQLLPEDVCYLNILQKISRVVNSPKRDTEVDIAGYARNIEMIQEERKRRGKI